MPRASRKRWFSPRFQQQLLRSAQARACHAAFPNCDFFLILVSESRLPCVITSASAVGTRGRAGQRASLGRRIVRKCGQFEEQSPQVRIGDGHRRRADTLRGTRRRRSYGGGVPVGCRDRHHLGCDGCRGQAKAAHGGEDAGLIHACPGGPGGRLDQQQDAVIAQADMTDMFAQWGGQQRNNSLAQVVNLTCPGSQIGNRRAL